MDLLRPRPVWAAVTAVTLAAGGSVAAWAQAPAPDPHEPAAAVTAARQSAAEPGLLAAVARAEREPLRTTYTPHAGEEAPPADVREHAAEVLADLPGGDAVEIEWNHPDIGNHLGGVRLDAPTVMMLNSHRFEAEPERVASTVMHEIGHYYQGAVIAARAEAAGGWWEAYWELDAALGAVFGSTWMESSADCVALHLGATWTHYTDDCADPAARDAVEALVALEMPS